MKIEVLLMLICILVQMNMGDPDAEMNKTKSFNISEFQVKTIPNHDVLQVQLNEVEERNTLSNDINRGLATKKGNQTLSRTITPTSNQNASVVAENVSLDVKTLTKTVEVKNEVGTKINNITATLLKDMSTPKSDGDTIAGITTSNSTKVDSAAASSNGANNSTNSTSLNLTSTTTAATTTTTAKPTSVKVPMLTSTITADKTTNTTTTTTTTTTTPKPKKPLITYGTEDFPDLDADVLASHATQQQKNTKTLAPEATPSLLLESPKMQASQEMNTSSSSLIPLLTVLFVAPLAIGIFITSYRRFKDFWSTRHYRRMDFLVDGMYND